MNLYCKIITCLFAILFALPVFAMKSNHGLDGYVENKIEVIKNARLHSNMGNIYFEERNYISALKEYEIAYNLAYNTQAGATYLYNIARCYMQVKKYNLAKNALEGVIKRDCMNLTYYKTLAQCICKLGIEKQELKKYIMDDSNPYNEIMTGLIYLEIGEKENAKITFDNFINKYPDMIITFDIKTLLNKI